jgi:hypothetical protein
VLPPNPADLLMSRKMQEVLNDLRNSFDFVLIDSPPAIAVSDAAVISAFCDGVLLVFHGQRTTTQSARQAVERLDSINATLLGVILNGVDIRNPDYVDYRSYYPSYYASMQEEMQGNRERSDDGWAFSAKGDDVIGSLEDLDRVMEELGFHQQRRQGNGHEARQDGERPSGFVPRPFFDRISAELHGAAGASAATVSKQVAALGESMEAFPIARIWELTQKISKEITERDTRARFLHTMAQEIRSLPSA